MQQQLTAAALQRFKQNIRLQCQFQGTGLIDKYKQCNPGFEPEEAPATVEAFLGMVKSAVLNHCTVAIQQHKLETSMQIDTQTKVHKLRVLS